MIANLTAAPLPDLTVIEVTGPDSTGFLQSQLTNDIAAALPDMAVLAGYCTAKGRLLATMIVFKNSLCDHTGWRLMVKSSIAESLVKRLAMYVLRAKVQLSVSPAAIFGLSSNDAASAVSDLDASVPDLVALTQRDSPWTVIRTPQGDCIVAPRAAGSGPRWWFISPSQALGADTNPKALAHWQAADIAAGLPWIVAATQDLFIPQTLNLDLVGGISFTKGCYPGQEVVARSHYRGRIKRRMAYGRIEQPGAQASELEAVDIFNARNPGNPCGRVINAAPDAGLQLLFEVQLADLGTADFRLGNPAGDPITVLELPYRITQELEDGAKDAPST